MKLYRLNWRKKAVLITALYSVLTLVGTVGQAKTMEEVKLSPALLAPECSPIEGEHAISIQAAVHYRMVDEDPTQAIRPARKSYQSFSCSGKETTIYYYEYATAKDVESALGPVKALIWGEERRSSMHPEIILPIENVLVIISSREAEFFAYAFFYGVPGNTGKEYGKALAAFRANSYAKAEEQFRALTRSAPNLLLGHLYLGHTLFFQSKYREAIPSYERARELAAQGVALSQVNKRVLTDQLGMAYAGTGRLSDARAVFEAAIQEDPEYPMYYYNLACTFAETGDIDMALANLKLGFARRSHMLPGETYPDPRRDVSFKGFLKNEKFQAAMKEMGY